MPYWDERVEAMATQYPDARMDNYHIDILAANFVLHPDRFDVVVASNLFGDILSDLGQPAPAPSASRRVRTSTRSAGSRDCSSRCTVRHPDIAGQGVANPIGQIWSGSLMLDHLGETEAAAAILRAVESALAGERDLLTPDLGGVGTTGSLGEAVASTAAR